MSRRTLCPIVSSVRGVSISMKGKFTRPRFPSRDLKHLIAGKSLPIIRSLFVLSGAFRSTNLPLFSVIADYLSKRPINVARLRSRFRRG